MIRKSRKQLPTLADKVNKLLAHPNDSETDEDSDVDTSTKARFVDSYDEYLQPDPGSTDFRKKNVQLLSDLSDKYRGKVSSRKELEEDEEQSDSDDEDLPYEASDTDEEETTAMEAFSKKLKASKSATAADDDDDSDDESMEEYKNGEDDDEHDSEDDDEDEEDDDNEDEEEDDENESENEYEAINVNEIMTKTNQQAEIQKGLCVQNQLYIWERMLEFRISTQRFTSKANQLPPPEALHAAKSDNDELQAVLMEAQERSSKLLQQLLALQSALTQQNSELRQSVKRKQPTEENTEPASKRFAHVLQSNFENMRSYRNEVLLKWDDRTKLLAPGAGVKRKSMQEDYDIIKKIDSALANRQVLLEKSQTIKINQQQKPEQSGEDAELNGGDHVGRQVHIYDDTDFYHQQLRELIEHKASNSSNMSDMTKQFVELQKLRQKMKKKVDTRASKGRKLRYVVHNKLINFMAPNEACDWTEETKTELFKSLFV